MIITYRKNKLYENFFIFTLCLYLFRTSFLDMRWNNNLAGLAETIRLWLKYVLILLIVFLFFWKLQEETIKWTISTGIIAVCLFISNRINQSSQLFFTGMFALLSINLSSTRILKYYFWTNFINILLMILFCMLHFSDDRIIRFAYGTAHSLGAGHPNTMAALFLSTLICWQIVYNRSQFNRKMEIVFLTTAVFIWYVFRSRTGVILIIIYPFFLGLIYLLRIVKSKIIINLLQFVVIFVFATCILLMVNENFRNLITDFAFRQRFAAPYQAYQTYGIHLFGSRFEFSTSYFGDSAYTYLIVACGVIPTLIILGLIFMLCSRCRRIGQDRLFAAIFIFILQGMMEQYMFRIAFNPTFLLVFTNIDPLRAEAESKEHSQPKHTGLIIQRAQGKAC